MADKWINFRIDPETKRKLLALSESQGRSMSDLFRGFVLHEYEKMTDTVRLPVVGRIANGKVFLDDSAEREYVGNDTERE